MGCKAQTAAIVVLWRGFEEDAIATRHALLDAAEQVFYDKGVARASLAEIAQAAGTTRGAVYWHFKDKLDLFHAMMDRVTLPLEQACHLGEITDEPLAYLRCVMEPLLHSVVHDTRTRRVFEIVIHRLEYVGELSAVRERHLAAHARFRAQLARHLALAAEQQRLALPVTVDMAAAGLHALYDGLLQSWLLDQPSDFDLLATGRATTNVYLYGLGFELPD